MSRFHKSCALLFVPLVLIFAPLRADVTKNWDEANAAIAVAKTPLEKANALYQKAGLPLAWFEKSTRADWEEAGRAMDEAFKLLDQVSNDGKGKIAGQDAFYFRRGYVANKLDNFTGAVNFYNEAEKAGYLAQHATNRNKGAELYSNRAEAKAALYDFAGALADLEQAIALNNNYIWVRQRAETRFEMGDWDGAVADWKRVVELNPNEKIEREVADLLDNTPKNEIKMPFDRYLVPFNKAIADNPNSAAPFVARARHRLARVQRELKYEFGIMRSFKQTEANKTAKSILRDLNRAIALEPKNAAAWRERGKTRGYFWVLSEGNGLDFDEKAPLLDFNRALNLEDSNALTRFETGFYLLTRSSPQPGKPVPGDLKERRKFDLQTAIMNFSRAIVKAPEANADAHYHRAFAERQTETPDQNTLLVDYSAVIAQQMKGIGDAPDDGEKSDMLSAARVMRGKILLSRGQRNVALQDFDAAIKVASLNYEARFERGKLRVIRGEYEDALEDLEVVTENTRSAEAWLWKAAAQDSKGDTEQAKTALQEAFKRDANLKSRVRGTRYDEATPTQKPLAPAPDKNDAKLLTGTALEHKNAGNELLNKGNASGALAEYSAAILLDPNFADGYNNRGGRYVVQEKYDLALADLNRAIELDPKHRLAYFNRSFVWRSLRDAEKQGADLDRAIEYADTPEGKATAYVMRAVAKAETNPASAQADLTAAVATAPKDAPILDQSGRLFLYFQRNDTARDTFRRLLELQPSNNTARLHLSFALAALNDEAAPGEFEKAFANAKAAEVADAKGTLDEVLKHQPDSALLKTMKERLANPKTP